jgi:hypothetical protein
LVVHEKEKVAKRLGMDDILFISEENAMPSYPFRVITQLHFAFSKKTADPLFPRMR